LIINTSRHGVSAFKLFLTNYCKVSKVSQFMICLFRRCHLPVCRQAGNAYDRVPHKALAVVQVPKHGVPMFRDETFSDKRNAINGTLWTDTNYSQI
jgi:hypothetical protein